MRRAARTCLIAAAALALTAAPALGASKIVVRGAGFGHGIGMSQYGAYGFAKHGAGYADILKHYYTGVELSKAPDQPVRVLLQQGPASVAVAGATSANGHKLERGATYVASKAGLNQVKLAKGGKKIATVASPLRFDTDATAIRVGGRAINGIGDGTYRGSIEVSVGTFGGVAVVNSVGLDDYVRGVIPGEVIPSWPADALRAQAVAARSYGIATGKGGKLFDQYPDTRSQVYAGEGRETAATNKAVDETADQVITYKGKVAAAYFFSASGGRTENVENVFYGSNPLPYLRGVDDPYDTAAPRHRWKFEYTKASLGAKLGGWVKGRFKGVEVVKRGVSPRIVAADVVGSGGKTRVKGADLKARLGWYDTWAVFTSLSSRAATTAHSSSWLSGLLARPAIAGRIEPAPARRRIVLERRGARGWRAVRRTRTSRSGAYRVAVRTAGTWRVRAKGFAGPPVRVGSR